jgi:hypothetical protein
MPDNEQRPRISQILLTGTSGVAGFLGTVIISVLDSRIPGFGTWILISISSGLLVVSLIYGCLGLVYLNDITKSGYFNLQAWATLLGFIFAGITTYAAYTSPDKESFDQEKAIKSIGMKLHSIDSIRISDLENRVKILEDSLKIESRNK